ncbi:hypothetical protein F5884DRAFT_680893 [Xylogone sp. PMI_703]|nr:hypothetical protein F5884DRAFT_680893 [Xylogone sp. PMI_703]
MDIKHVQAVQSNHADRLLRLEKRQADDAALKSVWTSPFPSVLGGTPQQGPIQNPSTDVFDDFDDEHGQHILESLQLETEEEPVRRGASRANSVRFDVSAIHGPNWAQGSRSSGEFAPTRPSSGFGGHPIERSLSHKSDGRHSSAGYSVHSTHSVPSGRTSSLGLDTNFVIGGGDDDSPLDIPDPPPGLFVLGSVPSIIRCWLSTNFSHNTLLYAVVCSGSQRSALDYSLVKSLGLQDMARESSTGGYSIKLPVYLPEAIVTQPTSRSNSPAPQLPTLTAEFELFNISEQSQSNSEKTIGVFLGSDTLRAHNADLLFSQNVMTLYGDDRSRLSVPFVRPEDEKMFKNLYTRNLPYEKRELESTDHSVIASVQDRKANSPAGAIQDSSLEQSENMTLESSSVRAHAGPDEAPLATGQPDAMNVIHHESENAPERNNKNSAAASGGYSMLKADPRAQNSVSQNTVEDSSRRDAPGSIWGSWRQTSLSANGENGRENDSTSGYQRPTRSGRTMKVLRHSKSGSTVASTRSASAVHTGAAYEPAAPRPSVESRRKSHGSGVDNNLPRWDSKKDASEESKTARPLTTLPKGSNPIGGASAFAWMNPGKAKASAATE